MLHRKERLPLVWGQATEVILLEAEAYAHRIVDRLSGVVHQRSCRCVRDEKSTVGHGRLTWRGLGGA
jgi:hypothetical protein